ncbi:MAG: ADOP family duplicated permease, partial [Gemmatimonadaceae bacterium]
MNAGELFRRFKLFVQRDRMTRELEDEMRMHQQLRAERVGPAAAQRRFGNTTAIQQQSRDAWGFVRLEDLTRDIQFAARRIWKQRGVSATVIVVMGIGIGATTAMFSAVDAALLRPLPFAKPEQLMLLPFNVPDDGAQPKPTSGDIDYAAVSNMTDLFSHVATYGVGGLNMSDDDRPLRLKVGVVTANFFGTLGVNASIGRTFTAREGVPNGPNVAILSDGLWKRAYGSRSPSGLTITLNRKLYDVVGVMPPAFTFPEESDVWIPMSVPYTRATSEAFRDYVRQATIGRVADNVTTEKAALQLLARIETSPGGRFPRHPADNAPWGAQKRLEGGVGQPLQKALVGDRKLALYVLLAATAMLLLIACANVTNLLLAQAAVRRREIAVRQVLGATRTRIIRQLLTESVLLSLAGALLGILIASGTFRALQALMPAGLAGLTGVHIDRRILGSSTLLAVVAGIVFGLWPAVGSARNNTSEAIKSGDGHGTTAAWSGKLRRVLVGVELAFTVVLLIAAGIMLRSFEKIVNRPTGIDTAHVGTMEIAFLASANIPERLRVLTAITERLSAMPGVEAAGASKTLPLATAGRLFVGIDVPGPQSDPDFRGNIPTIYEDAASGYFKALNIALLHGRLFNASEDRIESHSIIVSASTAKRYWPGVSAVGRIVRLQGDTLPFTIVGVVADVPEKLDARPRDQVYFPLAVHAPFVATIVARGVLPSGALLKQMTDAVRAVDARQPVFSLRMMYDVRDTSIAPRRTSTKFLTLFALLALTLASVGVYAVVSCGLAQRHRELGIRSALGATGGNLLALLSREMVWVAGIGVAVGLFGAWSGARILERLAYGVDVHDPITFIAVPVTLFLATPLATVV